MQPLVPELQVSDLAASLEFYTRVLGLEWAGTGVTANAICPGAFGTEMNRPLLDDPVKYKAFVANKKAKAYKPVDGWPSRHVPSRKAELRARFAEYLDNEAANF